MKDAALYGLVKKEDLRQKKGIELIPSENYASAHVRAVLSSSLVNKYSEGYPKKRYYGGNEVVDDVELLAIERAKKLFGVEYANVQPYSGSPANFAVLTALCKPGDPIMGQALVAGGHLTHGHKVSASGIYFDSVQYGVEKERGGEKNDLFNYAEIRKLARKHKPKVIWVGTSAYPLKLHYPMFAKIADEVGAYLVADFAHIAGLVAGGVHPSPVPYAHVITTTTHKTLRGPRGAMIMVTKKGLKKDPDITDKIDKAVFPGLQGGPHDNQTAAIAVALFEASQPSFKKYAEQVVLNSKALAKHLKKGGLKLVGDGSEVHLILVDLSVTHGPGAGVFGEKALDLVGLTLNKNTVPGEPMSPFYPSGIRLGTPAATSRGMKEKDMEFIANVMIEVMDIIAPYHMPEKKEDRQPAIKKFIADIHKNKKLAQLKKEVTVYVSPFPIP